MTTDDLVEAGRHHVACGRVREAMACFTRAADDPERGAEALSLLAAAYLLPGSLQPELALRSVSLAASHPAARPTHLARCAAVALSAGDPVLAEQLASRAAARDGGLAVAVEAAAKLRQGDRAGLRRLLAGLPRATNPAVYWRRVVVEALAKGWLPEAVATWRAMRRGGLPRPDPGYLLARALPPALYVAFLLAAAVVSLAVQSHGHVVEGSALGTLLLLTGVTVRADWSDGRPGNAAWGVVWMVAASSASLSLWLAG